MRQALRALTACVMVLCSSQELSHADSSSLYFNTLAGSPGTIVNSAEGTGSAAQFYSSRGVAVDSTGTVYVADTSNGSIRKITVAGVVTTLAGTAGSPGLTDGTGSAARFFNPKVSQRTAAGIATSPIEEIIRSARAAP